MFLFASGAVVGFTPPELWKSDGTEAGTLVVRDINPLGGSFPRSLVNVNGTLFFAANDGTNGKELWMSDGTAAGTVLVADINPGFDWSQPSSLTNVNGTLFFSADDGTVGSELWAFNAEHTEPGAIPTVSEWGMVVMTLLLLTAGIIVLGRRRPTYGS